MLEAFALPSHERGRAHIATLEEVRIGQSSKGLYLQPITVWGEGPFLVHFPPHQREWAEALAREVERARAAYLDGG